MQTCVPGITEVGSYSYSNTHKVGHFAQLGCASNVVCYNSLMGYNNKVHVQCEPHILKENLGTLTSESFIRFFEVPVCDILGWSLLLIYLF